MTVRQAQPTFSEALENIGGDLMVGGCVVLLPLWRARCARRVAARRS